MRPVFSTGAVYTGKMGGNQWKLKIADFKLQIADFFSQFAICNSKSAI